MGKSLYERFPYIRPLYDEAGEMLHADIKNICFHGPLTRLNKTEIMLPAIFLTGIAAYHVLEQETGIQPYVSAGHSLGEFTALTCAGVLTFDTAMKLIIWRSLTAERLSGAHNGMLMVVEQIGEETLQDIVESVKQHSPVIAIACHNAPDQFVLSGSREAIEHAKTVLQRRSAKVIPVFTSPAFHSQVMEELTAELHEALEKTELSAPKWPVYSNATGAYYIDRRDIIQQLSRQVSNKVKWYQIVSQMVEGDHVECFIDVGSNNILTQLIHRSYQQIDAIPLSGTNDIDGVKLAIYHSSAVSRAKENQLVIEQCLRYCVSIPNNNPDTTRYLRKATDPYKAFLSQIYDEDGYLISTQENVINAVNLLMAVIDAKKIPEPAKCRIFHDFIRELPESIDIVDFVKSQLFRSCEVELC